MLTDSTTLYWLAAASCVVVPVAIVLKAAIQCALDDEGDQLTNPNSINSRERN
jgi:hypothetical protein